MYFWNVNKLNKDLVKGLEQKEDFKYIIIFTILSMSMLFIPNEGNNIYDNISIGIEVFFGVGLLLYFIYM
ncbi:MAG: hypothetical protein Q9M97_02400 [Candidatus Gracilibacteria bacterium]|nr:hypothetical protein [Candidatus Gracilibacteria bacterium]